MFRHIKNVTPEPLFLLISIKQKPFNKNFSYLYISSQFWLNTFYYLDKKNTYIDKQTKRKIKKCELIICQSTVIHNNHINFNAKFYVVKNLVLYILKKCSDDKGINRD